MKIIKPNTLYLLIISTFYLGFSNGCIKNDIKNISNNLVINQSYSIPIGTRTFILTPLNPPSSIPGQYGTYMFNNINYTNDFLWFTLLPDTVPFNLVANGKEDWIKQVIFSTVIQDSFPTTVQWQVVMCDENKQAMDLVFKTGMRTVPAGQNYEGIIDTMTTTQIAYLKRTRYLVFQGQVCSKFSVNDPSIVNFLTGNSSTIKVGVRVDLQYYFKDL